MNLFILRPRVRPLRPALAITAALALVAGTGLAATAAPTLDTSTDNSSRKLRAAVTADAVLSHLTALDAIAEDNDDTRASGTEGYSDSVDYIVGKLRAAGYTPTVQPFVFPFFADLSPAVLEQTAPDDVLYGTDDVRSMQFSPAGDVSGPIEAVDTTGTATDTGTSGCEASDFDGFGEGSIALVQRGSCAFTVKAANAEAAGAAAVVIFNTGVGADTAAVDGTLGAPGLVGIPVVGASFAAGTDLIGGAVTGRVAVDTISENRETYNVIAETSTGDPDNVVMVGAHLDSVLAGPGINDNGTGSAAILAVAEGMGEVRTTNRVRFAWWGAEEEGLLGSEYYVADLAEQGGLDALGLYLNFDMIGSPNFARFVYDGDNSAFPVGPDAAAAPEGSGQIEQDFHDYFAAQGLASGETAFSGRSDYGPFIDRGIPSGGLFTGAEGIKTDEQASLFGGVAGAPYDACYHQACDDTDNVSIEALDQMSDAVAHLTVTYAASTAGVNGAGTPVKGKDKKDRFEGNPLGGGTESGGGLHPEHDHEAMDH